MSIESLWGPTPWDRDEDGREVTSGYFTILSLCCWSQSKKRLKAVGGRSRASAIKEVNSVERADICDM